VSIVGMKSERKYYKCPRCHGLLFLDYDGYESYFTCIDCGRSFNLKGEPTRMTSKELKTIVGIK